MFTTAVTLLSCGVLCILLILFFFEPSLGYKIEGLKTITDDDCFPDLLSRLIDSPREDVDDVRPLRSTFEKSLAFLGRVLARQE